MEYDSYTRSPPEPRPRDRDDYRSADAYRDRRRSPGPHARSTLYTRFSRLTIADRRRPEHTRRRSRSPQIDRYQPDRVPRDDYYRRDDGPRDRRRSSPQPVQNIDRYVPGQDAAPAPLLVNPMPDPMRLEFQVGFTWFAEWWRTEQRIKDDKERVKSGRPQPRLRGERETREEREIKRPKIQAAYDSYKENLQKNQAQTFVRLHKSEDWFRERYVDEVRVPFRANLMAFRQGLQAQWEQDLKDGVFDEFTLEGIYKSESNGAGGLLEKEEGETTAAAEVLGVGDLLPSKGGDLRDPVATQPTLLIKTIAPTVTREKFEAFAKELLGEGEGGYKHLSLSDPNPLKKCHRMGWIMLHPVSEPYGEDAVAAAESTDAMEDDDAADKPEQPETKARPLSTSDRALEKIDGKTLEDPERGNFTVHCGVHRPPDAPRKKALWDLFSAPERVARDLELATKLVRKLDNVLGDNILGVAMIEQRVQDLEDAGMLEPPALSKPAEKIADADAMDAEDEGEADEDEGQISEADEVDSATLLAQKKKLDLLVEYLRRVYNFCFFCVFEADSVHEMQRKCPGGHLRRPRGSLTSAAKETARASAQGEAFPLKRNGNGHLRTQSSGAEGAEVMDMGDGTESPLDERKGGMMKPSIRNAQQLQRAFNWVKTFEEKILQLLEPENVDVKKLGGVPLEEGMEEELQKVRIDSCLTRLNPANTCCSTSNKKTSPNTAAKRSQTASAPNSSNRPSSGASTSTSGTPTSSPASKPTSSSSTPTSVTPATSRLAEATRTATDTSPSAMAAGLWVPRGASCSRVKPAGLLCPVG